MTTQDASALATRLAETLDEKFQCWFRVLQEHPVADSLELAYELLPILQAQAVEDEDKCKVNKRLIVDFKNLHQTLIYRETELSALRALVGRMRTSLQEIARDAGDNRDRSGEYTSDRIQQALEEADKVAN